MSAAARSIVGRQHGGAPPQLGTYWRMAREPLHCLAFLLPLVATYEGGVLLLRPGGWPAQRLVAQRLLQQLGAWIGADAVWAPGAALLLTLLAWHCLRGRPWRVRAWVPALMAVESLALTLPLFALGRLLVQTTATGTTGRELPARIVLGLGAGVYEELVFRFYLIGGLLLLLARVCRVPRRPALTAAVTLATLAFAGCHFTPVGSESPSWRLFAMLAAGGGYLSAVYVLRGLGICTGCHAAYNVLSVLMNGG